MAEESAVPARLEQASAAVVEAFDFSSYDLDALRDDVRSVLDVSGAVAHLAKWAAGLAVGVGVLSWLVFGPRIESGLATFGFVVVSAALALPAGAAIGGWMLARRRLDLVTTASGRVVDMVADMHRDVVQLRAGAADTSVQRVAVGLLEEAVMPIVFGTVTEMAEGMLGPLGFLVRRVAAGPRALAERSVVAAIEALPDRRIGDLASSAIDGDRVESLVLGLSDDYERIGDRLSGIVQRVSRISLTVGLGAAVVAVLPLTLWWILGWVLS